MRFSYLVFNDPKNRMQKVLAFLDQLNVQYTTTNNDADIFIPSKNVGIDINEILFNSYNPHGSTVGIDSKSFHYDKWKACYDKGIKLLQFWSDEIEHKFPIVQSIIMNAIGMSVKRNARKGVVIPLKSEETRAFLDDNHLNGFANCVKSFGLIENQELVSVMTFAKSRFEKAEGVWELIRFASKKGVTVRGGGSKIIKKFFEFTPEAERLISYADLQMGNGNSYLAMGFEYVGLVAPGYWWCDEQKRIPRQRFQKHKLKKLFPHCDISKTEKEIMFAENYRILYNVGYHKYSITRNEVLKCQQ